MNNTAISRNFIKTPKIIGFALFATDCLAYLFLAPWSINPILNFIGSCIWGAGAFLVIDWVVDKLIARRVENWAEEFHGVDSEDLDIFLEGLEEGELEKMVAMDLEDGWDEEEDFAK